MATSNLSPRKRRNMAGEIRSKVTNANLTFVWLIHRLSDRGLFTDKFELSATLSGSRTGPKADDILTQSLAILTEYEVKMKT